MSAVHERRSREDTVMTRFFIALLMLPLAHGTALAQGNAQAGKALWDGPATQCRNCHGNNGEGAFGPDLAGRKLTAAQFTHAVRRPWGIMPAFIASQVSDAEIANLVAYFDGQPARSEERRVGKACGARRSADHE